MCAWGTGPFGVRFRDPHPPSDCRSRGPGEARSSDALASARTATRIRGPALIAPSRASGHCGGHGPAAHSSLGRSSERRLFQASDARSRGRVGVRPPPARARLAPASVEEERRRADHSCPCEPVADPGAPNLPSACHAASVGDCWHATVVRTHPCSATRIVAGSLPFSSVTAVPGRGRGAAVAAAFARGVDTPTAPVEEGGRPTSRLDGWKHGCRRELDLLRLVAERPEVDALTACLRVA